VKAVELRVDSLNVVNWRPKIVILCFVQLTAIWVYQTVDNSSVVKWIERILLHFAVLIIVIAVEKRVDCFNVVNSIQKNCIALCCAVNSDSGTTDSG